MTITIIGGGSLGHVCLGVISSRPDITLNLLTSRPERWQNNIIVSDTEGREYKGEIARISSNPADVVPQADVILLCLPGFLIEQILLSIRPFLRKETAVGSIVSSTGFWFFAHDILPSGTPLFGFQRVPFIARVGEYGRSGRLLGYKSSLAVAMEGVNDQEQLRAMIESLFNTPTTLLGSFYEAALTNSNPILHTSRLFSLWGTWDGKAENRCILFYKEWTIEAAELLIAMDNEFMSLLEKLPMNKAAIPSILDYYDSHDAESLCRKLQSIAAFATIPAPMIETEEGWMPDFDSRYFTEDFPFGLRFIVDLARQNNVPTPLIDRVFEWGMSRIKGEG